MHNDAILQMCEPRIPTTKTLTDTLLAAGRSGVINSGYKRNRGARYTEYNRTRNVCIPEKKDYIK